MKSNSIHCLLLAAIIFTFTQGQLFLQETQESSSQVEIPLDEQQQIAEFLNLLSEEFEQNLAQQVFDMELIKWIIIYKDLKFSDPDFSSSKKEISSTSDKVTYSGVAIDLKFKFKVLSSDLPQNYYEGTFQIKDIEISMQTVPVKEYSMRVYKTEVSVLDESIQMESDMISEMNSFLVSYLEGLVTDNNQRRHRRMDQASNEVRVKKSNLEAKRKDVEAARNVSLSPEEDIAIQEFYEVLEQVYIDRLAQGNTTKVTEDDPDIFEVYEELKAKAIRDGSLFEESETSSESESEQKTISAETVRMPEEWSEETKSSYLQFLEKVSKKVVKWERVSMKKLKSIGRKFTLKGKIERGVITVEHDIESAAKSSIEDIKHLFGGGH